MRRLLLVLTVLLGTLLGVLGLPALAGTAVAAPVVGGQSAYVPLEPVRLLDTRVTRTPLGPGQTRDLLVAGVAGVPAGATAVVLTLTAVGATSSTDVRAYPTPAGEEVPEVSTLNAVPGSVVANLATVEVGRDGSVRLRNTAGSVHLLVDLSGHYAEGSGGSSYDAVEPRRLLDTREAGGALGAGEVRTLRVAGREGAAPIGATAVALNVTAVGATRQTDVRVYPTRAGTAPPTVSSSNPAPGRPTAAAVVATVGDGGSVDLRNGGGSVHLVVDLAGWFLPGTGADQPASVFHPLAPYRVLDTRTAAAPPDVAPVPGPPPVPPTPLAAGETRDVVVGGARAVPPSATAVLLNVTAVGPTATTDVRAYPAPVDGAVPLASSLNATRGQTVANAVLARTGRDGAVRLRNGAGSVHLVVDVAGWFGPAGDGWDVSWPQCTSRGSTVSRLPSGGAFAVVGLTRGVPFTDNECFAAQWALASTLPGEPSVYLNTNAPGPTDTADGRHWTDPGPGGCSGAASDPGCGFGYGWNLAGYALERLPTTPRGGRPMVWLDVEGPYAQGPFWQTGYAGAVAVNRAVVRGAHARLLLAGVRTGVYTDRATSSSPDWRQIMGDYRLPVPTWVFRAPTADPQPLCTPDNSPTGGPVVMVQVQPEQSGQPYDVDRTC